MARFAKLLRSSPLQLDLALLAVRLWFGLALAFAHGLGKVTNLAGFTEGIVKRGLPLPWLLGPAAALSELVGGLLIAIGLVTRGAALTVLGTMLVAALHAHAADPFARKELALCYAAAALALLIGGAGKLSIDGMLSRR